MFRSLALSVTLAFAVAMVAPAAELTCLGPWKG